MILGRRQVAKAWRSRRPRPPCSRILPIRTVAAPIGSV